MPEPHTRRTRRALTRDHPLNRNFIPFSPELVGKAIKASGNYTTPGPDQLNIYHLRHLGEKGMKYLCFLFNLSLQRADIPAIWEEATRVANPKPGKLTDQGSFYRPISRISPIVKVLERLLLPEITLCLSLSNTQHGYRKGRSTTSALLPLTQRLAAGFNENRPYHARWRWQWIFPKLSTPSITPSF